MKKVKYRGEKYTVESEALGFYHLSGGIWAKKEECKPYFEDWDLAKEIGMGLLLVGAFIFLYLVGNV